MKSLLIDAKSWERKIRKSAIMQRSWHFETVELINLIVYKINFLVLMYVS